MLNNNTVLQKMTVCANRVITGFVSNQNKIGAVCFVSIVFVWRSEKKLQDGRQAT